MWCEGLEETQDGPHEVDGELHRAKWPKVVQQAATVFENLLTQLRGLLRDTLLLECVHNGVGEQKGGSPAARTSEVARYSEWWKP